MKKNSIKEKHLEKCFPNCHSKMHVLHKVADVKKLQDKIRSYLEDDKDTDNIAELDKIRKHN